MYYQDYRENLQNILDNIKGDQDSLNLGAVAIISLLDMAMVKEDGDESDEDQEEQAENEDEDANRENVNETDDVKEEAETEDNSEEPPEEPEVEAENEKEREITAEKAAEETAEEPTPAPEPEIQTVEAEYGVTPGNRAVIAERALQGVRLHNANTNEYIGILNEEITRRFNIGNGSLIEVKPIEGRYAFVKTLHQVDEPDENDVFHFAVVKKESSANILYVDSNVGGDQLSDYNPTQNTYFIPTVVNKLTSSSGFVNEGDILDLAWKEDRPEEIRIRWVYPDTNLGAMPSHKATTPKKGVPTPKNVKEEKHKTNESMTNIAYNLKGKKVVVVIGNEIRSTVVRSLISAHNGNAEVIDAFKFSNVDKYYKKALRHTDLVVMVQNLNKHATSKTLQKYVKKYKLRFAIADSAGLSSIERAVYRAYKGLPAYETTNQPVEYPMAE